MANGANEGILARHGRLKCQGQFSTQGQLIVESHPCGRWPDATHPLSGYANRNVWEHFDEILCQRFFTDLK